MTLLNLPDNTPVIIAVGEFTQAVPDALSEALSPADIAGQAASAAIESLGIKGLAQQIDLIASVRTFSDSSPAYTSPIGRSDNFPMSVGARIGAKPKHLIYDVIGGQSPQKLVTECCTSLADGAFEMALVVGGEALGNMKAAQRAAQQNGSKKAMAEGQKNLSKGTFLDWSESPDLPSETVFEDRGFGSIEKMVSAAEVNHGLFDPMLYYGFMETAYRYETRLNQTAYTEKMAAILAPLSEVAEDNPFAMFRERFSVSELSRSSSRNRKMTTPFLKHFVAKDGVNQGAAVLLTTVGKAKALNIPREAWVFLHGASDTEDRLLLERPNLGKSTALKAALNGALNHAGINSDRLTHFDLYSCFPVVLFNSCEVLGIKSGDPRSLTQTGGLPFFGGPGNNYTLHGIAAMIKTLRENRDDFGLVHGNGGWMSKHSVGVYSSKAPTAAWSAPENKALRDLLQLELPHPTTQSAEGRAKIESYIVIHARGEPLSALTIGTLDKTGERFYARAAMNSKRVLDAVMTASQGQSISVRSTEQGNVFELIESIFE